ncbi:hypothetical protein [Methylobacterium nodulans]|uniref:Rad50/SbcC-type AAA domain-containing protein n=1 Tax=Methylobacterium nodulans (strain LMG 21967 / CNCM I-2342 / ORS 2060) TaxID=460265 RepID=B8I9N4_METNO|nr:hypothetical protein [Methylobacterium nodulans]ACL55287.1 conserved hypothetical protein [Methylobacterium nodulans ORS 2060]
MTLRLRHLRMRAMTSAGLYGTDIGFELGLNVIWADNTKGKSTCMQGMLYALGLEKMLSPRREVPLPHAMTSFLRNDDETTATILESGVSLEIQNGAGTIVTVHRPVKKAGVDNRLISVDFGPTLTDPEARPERRDFFVLDAGAAQREDGFHRFLEDFLGWQLPIVRRYDSPEGKLYLETIFPLFWVEQKAGWSSIPAAIPTYLRIREVQKRAVEFIMDLNIHKLELERQRLQERIDQNARDWRNLWDEIDRYARRSGGKTDALPQRPTIVPNELAKGHVLIAEKGSWVSLKDMLAQLRGRVAELNGVPVPAVGTSVDHLERQLEALGKEVEGVNRARIEVHKAKQLKEADIGSLERRIRSLADDMQKNQDVQKFQRYSGTARSLTPDYCPTCEQALVDSLMSQKVLTAIMPIEDNIEYIRSQMKMFDDILKREQEEMSKIEIRTAQVDRDLNELYSRIRTVRTDLIAPTGNPSAVAIEERVRTEARIRELETIQATFDDTVARMQTLASAFGDLLLAVADLPKDKMSPLDRSKFDTLTALLRQLAREFGFSTFDASELTIDEDTYRPQKEGYEIGFETSASDAIRLKWAYQLGLLELSHRHPTHHPGMLLLDEPRQQSSSRVSFGSLLERAATHQRVDQQIIISTSEDLEMLKEILSRITCKDTIIPGYVIKPVSVTGSVH